MIKRSWFCQCGWTWDEETGEYLNAEGNEGSSNRYCSGCNSITKLEWRVIENTDPDDELDKPSAFCFYCQQLLEAGNVEQEYKNYAYPVCDKCISNGEANAKG